MSQVMEKERALFVLLVVGPSCVAIFVNFYYLRIAFLREERARVGSSTLPVKDWMARAPQPSGVLTIQQAEQSLREALEHLRGKKQLSIRKAKADRWNVSAWSITLKD